MVKTPTSVLLLVVLPLMCFGGEDRVLPPLEIPVLTDASAIQVDGELTDWRQVIGPPMLTEQNTWQDPTVDDGGDRPYFLAHEVWIAIAPSGSRASRP